MQDIGRIENQFSRWEDASEILRLKYVRGMSTEDAISATFNCIICCDDWQATRRHGYRLIEQAFQAIAEQVR